MINEQCAYSIKGIDLTLQEMKTIHDKYEIMYTAEFILDNYDITEEDANQLAIEAGDCMSESIANGNPITEEEAIKEASENLGIDLIEIEENIEKE